MGRDSSRPHHDVPSLRIHRRDARSEQGHNRQSRLARIHKPSARHSRLRHVPRNHPANIVVLVHDRRVDGRVDVAALNRFSCPLRPE
jgi:hypothetical protein